MNEHLGSTTIDMEKTLERSALYIGKLSDLGLGNPNGIPSAYAKSSPEEMNELANEAVQNLVKVTDMRACACIDGRHTNCNADGSAAEVRLRRVGGSASNYGVALNAESSVAHTIPAEASLGEQITAIDSYIESATGFERSAHKGGCGGANGEVEDNEAINTNPAILEAVRAFMSIPAVETYLGTTYDDGLGERVRANAGATAELQRKAGWNGQAYVDGVEAEVPRSVEDLEVDHKDEKFHGHKENVLEIIIGDETEADDDKFVWNLKASKMIAEALAGERGQEGYTQALIAEIAKHMAVANRLPSSDTPVVLLIAQ